MFYTGVGSRQTPEQWQTYMFQVAQFLGSRGYTLRSGGAEGADEAFEEGVDAAGYPKEIFIPWDGFNNHWVGRHEGILLMKDARAEGIASKFHPAWERLRSGAKKLHTRNVYQVLGQTLDKPSNFLVCWTPDGMGSGGTGQALRIAQSYNVPIYDLGSQSAAMAFEAFTRSIAGC